MRNAYNGFWVRWPYQRMLHISASLEPEEGYVHNQIINMILCSNGPIPLDFRHIGGQCHNMQGAKAKRIVGNLLQKGIIFLTSDGNISDPEVEVMLKDREDYLRNYQKKLKNFEKIKDENEEDQRLDVEDYSTKKSDLDGLHNIRLDKNIYDRSVFDVEIDLNDDDREEIKRQAQGYDFQSLIRTFNWMVNSGNFVRPDKAVPAFRAWVINYTKGRKP